MGPRIHHPRPHRHADRPQRPTTETHRDEAHPAIETPAPHTVPTSPPLFHPIGFTLDLPRISLPTVTARSGNPLFRPNQANSMTPMDAPTTQATVAPHLQTRSAVDQLEDQIKAEIQRRQAHLDREHARHPQRTAPSDSRLTALLRLRDELGRLKTAGQIRSPGFRRLVAQARQLLLEGAVNHQREKVQEGHRIATATYNYYQAHTRREQILQIIRDHYPPSSRGIQTGYFHVTDEERNPNDPSTDTLNNIAIIRTYERLSRSTNSTDNEMAHAFSGAIAELHNPFTLSDTATIEDVETGTILFHNLYGNPTDPEHPHAIARFLGQVGETTRQDLEHNEGYQSRRRLQDSLASLENLRQSARILESTGDALPPEVVHQTRDMLIQRLSSAEQSIVQEMRRLEASRPYDQTARYREGNQWIEESVPSRTPTPEEARLEQLHQECRALQSRLRSLQDNDPQATHTLTEAVHITLRAEEENTRILLHGELRQANSPELTDEINRVQTGTGNFSDLEVRLEHYQHAMERMDTAIMRESIRGRIEMYRSMLPLVQTTDRTMTVLSAGQGGDSDFSSRYEELIHRYERIDQSIDAGHLDQARRDFIQLEQAQVGQELQEHFVFSGRLQTGIAIGIVAASAATMNIAGLALMPETALAIEAGEATLGARMAYAAATAPAFQLTHYVASDFLTGTNHLYDPNQTVGQNLFRYAEDYARNVGNNIAIGETLRFVQQTAFARIAERQLIQEGALAANGMRSAAEGALIRARAVRVAQDGLTSTAVSTAALGPELGAVQAWGFLDRNLTDALHGRFDLTRGTEETLLSTQTWQDQAIFILGMRVGHLTTTPLLGPINGAARNIAIARVRGRYTEALRASQTAGEAWNRYVTQGEGRGADVRARLREAIEARQRLEQHPSVRDLISPEQHAETQRLSDALARANDMRLSNPFRSPWAGLTFVALGADGGAAFIRPTRSTRRSTSSNPPTSSPSRTTSHPQLRTVGLISAILDMPEVVSSHRQGSHEVEVATSVEGLATTRQHITQRARQLGLRGVQNFGSDDLIFENPHTNPPERLTIRFTRLQGATILDPTRANLPESNNPSANTSYIAARRLQRLLQERGISLNTISYDPNGRRLILRTNPGADLIADGNLIESLLPESQGQNIFREDPGDGRHILRVTNADRSPLLTVEITRRDVAGQPPRLPNSQNRTLEATTARRSRRGRHATTTPSTPNTASPIAETPQPQPRTLPRTAAGIRTAQALGDWLMRRMNIVDPATAHRAILPDHMHYDEAHHRVVIAVPESQVGQARQYISLFMGGRLVGSSRPTPDVLILRMRTSVGQPELIVEITGTRSYRNPVTVEDRQPGTQAPSEAPTASPGIEPQSVTTQMPPTLTQPISLDIYHFCHSPLGLAGERTRGIGYSFESGSRNLIILHGIGNRNEAKDTLRNQAAARHIPITEISETHWRLGGSDGVDVNFQALNP